jgi:hypothetical protein
MRWVCLFNPRLLPGLLHLRDRQGLFCSERVQQHAETLS